MEMIRFKSAAQVGSAVAVLAVVFLAASRLPQLRSGTVDRPEQPSSAPLSWLLNVKARRLHQDDENDKHADEEVKLFVLELNASRLLPLPTTVDDRCALAKGSWCSQYMAETPVPRYPPSYHDKPCPKNCNGVGVCNLEFGICYCPAGWGGDDCTQPRKRRCLHMGTDKRDANWFNLTAWSHTRCSGVCDDDIAMCYCPPETKYGRKEAPPNSPPGTPPLQAGRPLFMCNPLTDQSKSQEVKWGNMPYDDLFGPEGWCNADTPKSTCACRMDGLQGILCDKIVEQTCLNQCSGHGTCNQGFCHCYDGYYGSDCGRRRAGKLPEDGDEILSKPHIQSAITHVVATEDPPLTPTRKRPYIYVYDMKPDYSTDIWQYRIEAPHCLYRQFDSRNKATWVGYNGYGIEPALHELFLASEHRTLDPEEADFFFVPLSLACLFDVYGWNEVPRWPQGLLAPRSHGAAMMQREAMRWINATFPWFARRGGRDHIWLTSHDEGACYVWKDIWPGIMLTHWGRTDFPHYSGTGYGTDNYSLSIVHDAHPGDWRDHTSRTHPCFDPAKDLVIPAFKHPTNYFRSPFLGNPVPAGGRDIFAFHIGDLRLEPGRDPNCVYSRCVRQRLYNISKEQDWRAKHNILYGERKDIGEGEYSDMLSRSLFCFVLMGDGYSPRLEDAMLHGCIPVIIMDDVQVIFETILDVPAFSVRIPESDLGQVLERLKAISLEQIKTMQANLAKVWQRYRYMGLQLLKEDAKERVTKYMKQADGKAPRHPGTAYVLSAQDDAFATIMQWLHSRMPAVHGTGADTGAGAGAGALTTGQGGAGAGGAAATA